MRESRYAQHRVSSSRPAWSSVAFVVEAMLLLVFLIASLALFTNLFAGAVTQSKEGATLTDAVALATSAAERFEADPEYAAGNMQDGDLRVNCDVTSEQRAGGTLYHAVIKVYATDADYLAYTSSNEFEPVYTLETSAYESEVV